MQVLYSRLYRQRPTFKEIKELAHAIGRPPYRWTPEKLWQAYATLDRSTVRGSGGRVLTDIVSLVRFALAQDDELVSYPELVGERFRAWLLQQQNAGRTFTPDQLSWLERIRDHIAAALAVSAEDFGYTPFIEQGGIGKAYELFGEELRPRPSAGRAVAPRAAEARAAVRGTTRAQRFARSARLATITHRHARSSVRGIGATSSTLVV